VGGAQRATYTTGPATRAALAAAGAHGATTGTVVHLPAPPSAAPGPLLGVVAHELAHARYPVTRPRFLLGLPHGGIDTDERSALAMGRQYASGAASSLTSSATGAASAVTSQAQSMGAGIVGDLPVGGLTRVAGLAGQAEGAVDGYVGQARGALDGAVPDMPSLPDMPQLPSLPSLPSGVPGAADLSAQASSAMGTAGSIVDSATGSLASAAGADGVPGGAPPPSTVDIDRLADLLEQRLIKQIERRGGRYSGVF
jgi:hypothetical protein